MAIIALGVTGGIGAYKAVEVARGLQKRGHDVVAVMTHSATRFVGAVTFEAITRHLLDRMREGNLDRAQVQLLFEGDDGVGGSKTSPQEAHAVQFAQPFAV